MCRKTNAESNACLMYSFILKPYWMSQILSAHNQLNSIVKLASDVFVNT